MKIINITKLSKIWRIHANRTNWGFIKSKIVYNLALIYHSGIVDYLIDHLKNPKAIVLFGSYRNGEDITSSDIDIAVENDAEREKTGTFYLKEFLTQRDKEKVEELEQLLARKIQIHLFHKKTIDTNVFRNIANGIVLWGFLDVNK